VARRRWWNWRAESYRELAISAPLFFVLLTALLLTFKADPQRAITYVAIFTVVQTLLELSRIRRTQRDRQGQQ
jgi:hypothetical protein